MTARVKTNIFIILACVLWGFYSKDWLLGLSIYVSVVAICRVAVVIKFGDFE